MKLVRNGVFETNSSSTHSITMCLESDYEKWKNGELYYYENDNEFVTKEKRSEIIRKMVLKNKIKVDYENKTITFKGEIYSYSDYKDREKKTSELLTEENLAEITQEEIDNLLENDFDKDIMPCSYEQYYENLEYDTYKETFKTPNGEEVVSFGYYGQNY